MLKFLDINTIVWVVRDRPVNSFSGPYYIHSWPLCTVDGRSLDEITDISDMSYVIGNPNSPEDFFEWVAATRVYTSLEEAMEAFKKLDLADCSKIQEHLSSLKLRVKNV